VTRTLGLWPSVSLAACALVTLLVAVDAAPAVRGPAVVAFVLLVPGLALVRLLHLRDRLAEHGLANALGIGLAVIVPTTMMYAGAWSPRVAFAIIVGVALCATAVEVVRTRTR
jgi:hypothetical protein